LKLGVVESHQPNTYEYLDLSTTYMFLIKAGTRLKTRLYEEYSWDIAHNQKAIEFTTYKQKSSSLVEMLKLMKMLLEIGKKKKSLKATL